MQRGGVTAREYPRPLLDTPTPLSWSCCVTKTGLNFKPEDTILAKNSFHKQAHLRNAKF